MIRGSALERLLACPASAALPQVRSTSDAATLGTAIHKAAELLGNGASVEVALAELPPDVRSAFEGENLTELSHPTMPGIAQWFTETAVWFDVASGRAWAECLGEPPSDFDLSGPFVISGHLDLGGFGPGVVAVRDYKSGHVTVRNRDNAQLRFYALCLMRTFGVARALVQIVYVRNGKVWRTEIDELDDLDLDAFAYDLRQLQMRVAELRVDGGPFDLQEGPHCAYCPAFNACPAKMSLAIAASRGQADVLKRLGVERMSRADGPRIIEAVALLRQMANRLDATAKAWALEEPIFDPTTGRSWGRYQTEGDEKLDGDTTYAVARELYGPEVAAECIDKKGVKTRIDKAIRKIEDGDSLAERRRKILDEVRKRGGARRDSEDRWGWR